MPSATRLSLIWWAVIGALSCATTASLAVGRAAQASLPPAVPAAADPDPTWIDLLPPTGFDGWEVVAAEGQPADAIAWTRVKDELHCTGKPNGYLRTSQAYDDYILELEWKYPEGGSGNSGVLVNIETPDKVWPKCVQVQMLNDSVGRMFPMQGADAGDSAPGENLAAPAGAWNHWRLEVLGERITLKVRKKDTWVEANTVIVRSPTKGYIGLQSEDSRVVFRNLRLAVPAKAEASKPEAAKTVGPVEAPAPTKPDEPKLAD